MSEVLISATGLGKSYPKVHRNSDRLRALGRLLVGRGNADSQSVLRDVDLVVRRGESLGVIGENGAGKSTLLKLLTGVLTPSSGSVHVNGSIGALLELGAGFHPDYTGRDNIAMAAALHGLSNEEMRARLPEIIAFADIGSYIDEPVRHYSSGMIVRLGFAVIAALKPDVLITDEVLAVGDESFQKKCVRWIENYLAEGGTLLLVSHSMYHIQKLCRQAIWLQHGAVAQAGDVFDVSQAYLAWHERKSAPAADAARERDQAALEFSVESAELNGVTGDGSVVIDVGGALHIRATLYSRDGRVPVAMVGVVRADGTPVYGVSTEMEGVRLLPSTDGRYVVEIEFPQLPLLPGSYNVRIHPLDPEGVRLFDTHERLMTVRGQSREFGMVRLQHTWEGVTTND